MKILKQGPNGLITLTDIDAAEHAFLILAIQRAKDWPILSEKLLKVLLQPIR